MNLKEVMDSIETIPNVSIALDLSVHQLCNFDSNCPKAIRLRELIAGAGIDMGQILQGYAQITSQPALNRPITPEELIPNIDSTTDGRVGITVAGITQTFDFTDQIRQQLRRNLLERIRRIQVERASIGTIANSLYLAYTRAMYRAKENRVVEQLHFPIAELLANKVISNKGEGGGYDFFFPVTYEPGYLIESGIRYKISRADRERIRRDNLFLKITITSSKTFHDVTLIYNDSRIFQHYHGSSWDCWGSMTLPSRWDGTVRQLQQIVHERMGSLSTINLNSILLHQPTGMPADEVLKTRATRLGREGEIRQTNELPINSNVEILAVEPAFVQQPVRTTWRRH